MGLEDKRYNEKERLKRLADRRPKTDEYPGTGVVLSDGIEFYCHQFDLISPFEPRNLKPANYKLRVGGQYALDGEIKLLSDEPGKDTVIIPPFAVAVIQTFETINMPQFLIARWNIQVQRAYEGLQWVGGPQVDAGFVGHLACPIYNLSDKEVRLRYRDPFAVIDFVKTTTFISGKSKTYEPIPPDRVIFEDYNPQNLRSGLTTHVTQRLEGFGASIEELRNSTNDSIKRLQDQSLAFLGITLTLIAILFAALAVMVTSSSGSAANVYTVAAFAGAVLAVIIAWIAFLRNRR